MPRSPESTYDPLADRRAPDGPEFDVFLWGTVFLDIVFTGLESMPAQRHRGLGRRDGLLPGRHRQPGRSPPAGSGLRTSLAAAFGDDDYADFCWRTLAEQEHVDLQRSRRFERWHSPVTVSMAVNRRPQHGHPRARRADDGHRDDRPAAALPGRVRRPQPGRAARHAATGRRGPTWPATEGALVFADVGWDPTGAWSGHVLDQLSACHAFMPNAAEAMAYTRTDTPHDALYALADRVPLAVVTNGAQGALAIDGTTGEEAHVPALRVPALDPTGAGDVFGASMVVGTLSGWPLADRVAFATLCSALAVQQFGGSLAAPGWGDIADWWHTVRDNGQRGSYHSSLMRRYAFLEEIVPTLPVGAVRRAAATIARHADVEVIP